MNTFPFVVLLSEDTVLTDLLKQLLTRERFLFKGVDSAHEVLALCSQAEGGPAAVLLDTIESVDEARRLLREVAEGLCGPGPSLLLLTGSTTAADVRNDPVVDGIVSVPVCADHLIEVVGRHARTPKTVATGKPMGTGSVARLPKGAGRATDGAATPGPRKVAHAG